MFGIVDLYERLLMRWFEECLKRMVIELVVEVEGINILFLSNLFEMKFEESTYSYK